MRKGKFLPMLSMTPVLASGLRKRPGFAKSADQFVASGAFTKRRQIERCRYTVSAQFWDRQKEMAFIRQIKIIGENESFSIEDCRVTFRVQEPGHRIVESHPCISLFPLTSIGSGVIKDSTNLVEHYNFAKASH